MTVMTDSIQVMMVAMMTVQMAMVMVTVMGDGGYYCYVGYGDDGGDDDGGAEWRW